MKYTIINKATGRIENIITWNGERPYNLHPSQEMRPFQEGDKIYSEPVTPDLSAAQFHYMLASAKLHSVMNGVLDYLEDNEHPMFPAVYGHLAGQRFELSKTLEILGDLRLLVNLLYPDANVSEEAITDAWMLAAAWNS